MNHAYSKVTPVKSLFRSTQNQMFPNEKDYKSKTSSPPNFISSSHVSSSLNLYQLDPHTALSSSLWIS